MTRRTLEPRFHEVRGRTASSQTDIPLEKKLLQSQRSCYNAAFLFNKQNKTKKQQSLNTEVLVTRFVQKSVPTCAVCLCVSLLCMRGAREQICLHISTSLGFFPTARPAKSLCEVFSGVRAALPLRAADQKPHTRHPTARQESERQAVQYR